jgi:hypothetical protein
MVDFGDNGLLPDKERVISNILNLLEKKSVDKKVKIYWGLIRGYNRKITCKDTLH